MSETRPPEPDRLLPPGWARLSIRCERDDGQFTLAITTLPLLDSDTVAAHKAVTGTLDALHRLRSL